MINIAKASVRGEIDYRDEAIKTQIQNEFLKKCYLCEGYPIQNYEIDHFYPQNVYPHLTNSYQNLFFSCSKCNKIRAKKINTSSENEVLNSCEDDDDVENSIVLDINLDDCRKAVITANYGDDVYYNQKIDNTIVLLEKIYNGVGTKSEAYKCLKDDIVENIASFRLELQMYQDDYRGTQLESRFRDRLLKELDKSSKYSGFKKTIFKSLQIEI